MNSISGAPYGFHTSFWETFSSLPRASLEFTQRLRPSDLRAFDSLDSLDVSLFEKSPHEDGFYTAHRPRSDVPMSVQLRELVLQNPSIKDLSIHLETLADAELRYREESSSALERIGEIGPTLRSLQLYGKLLFSHAAREMWTPSFSNLRSLSLQNTDLTPEFFASIPGPLHRLRKLELHGDRTDSWGQVCMFDNDIEAVKSFLSNLCLTHLTLSGFSIELVLYVAKVYGPLLESLHLYQFGKFSLVAGVPPGLVPAGFSQYEFSVARAQKWMPSNLDSVRRSLTGLRSFGLNVEAHHLSIIKPAPLQACQVTGKDGRLPSEAIHKQSTKSVMLR
jgi:hypothetical protein